MELTIEQQSAIQRGEPVSLWFPNLDLECVVIDKQRFQALEQEACFQLEMHLARSEFQQTVSAEKLRSLANSKKPPMAWYQEDFSDLVTEES